MAVTGAQKAVFPHHVMFQPTGYVPERVCVVCVCVWDCVCGTVCACVEFVFVWGCVRVCVCGCVRECVYEGCGWMSCVWVFSVFVWAQVCGCGWMSCVGFCLWAWVWVWGGCGSAAFVPARCFCELGRMVC
jgi:hypothetical protein